MTSLFILSGIIITSVAAVAAFMNLMLGTFTAFKPVVQDYNLHETLILSDYSSNRDTGEIPANAEDSVKPDSVLHSYEKPFQGIIENVNGCLTVAGYPISKTYSEIGQAGNVVEVGIEWNETKKRKEVFLIKFLTLPEIDVNSFRGIPETQPINNQLIKVVNRRVIKADNTNTVIKGYRNIYFAIGNIKNRTHQFQLIDLVINDATVTVAFVF